ncbi:MAG: hypothetical protein P1P88_05005 [Bacteroidales bacterium]|nr:hypothetical protein [Bacteroidales bacterium]
MKTIDIEELIAAWSGIDIDNDDDYFDKLEDWVYDNFEISFENLDKLINKIFNGLDCQISPLTAKPYIGISNENMWLIKKELPLGNFISNIILWLKDGKDLDKSEPIYKTITVNGEPKYNIYLNEYDYE